MLTRRVLLAIAVAAVVVLCAVTTLVVRQRRHNEATYRVRLAVQTLPPCNIEVLVATYVDERRPLTQTDETPPYAALNGSNAAQWSGQEGEASIVTDSGDGPVKRAHFETARGDALDLASYKYPAPGTEVIC